MSKNINTTFNDGVVSGKSSTIATLLVTFLGYFGAHRFYTGYFLIGLFQLLTCGGFIIWFIIDIIAIYINKFDDSKGNPLANYNRKIASGMVLLAVIAAFSWGCVYANLIQKTILKFKGIQVATPLDNVVKANSNDIIEKYGMQSESEPEIVAKQEYKYKTSTGLGIIEDNICYGINNAKMICGTIVNTANSPARNIIIKFYLYDKNKNFIAFTEAKIYTLDKKEQFEFQAPIYYNTVDNYKLFKITSQ